MQRHGGMKSMASPMEPSQRVCFRWEPRDIWVEEAGDRAGAGARLQRGLAGGPRAQASPGGTSVSQQLCVGARSLDSGI